MRSETFNAQSVIGDHDDLLDFGVHAGLLENFSLLGSKTSLNRKLKAIGFKKVPKYFDVKGIGKKRGGDYVGLMGLCERSRSIPPRWSIEVETSVNRDKVNVGAVLHEMGHYVEQLCSNNGELKMSMERRGSSFDAACLLVGRITVERSDESYVLRGADELIANINATWIAWACGIDPIHCAAMLVKQSRLFFVDTLGDVLWFIPEELASALMNRDFYAREIETKGWSSEVEMCRVMDAATAKLMRKLHRGFKHEKKIEGSDMVDESNHTESTYYGSLRQYPKSNEIGERAWSLAMDATGELLAVIYLYPPVVAAPAGGYRIQSSAERAEIMVTVVKEKLGLKPVRQTVHDFLEMHPEMAVKIKDVLVRVGL